MINVMSFLEAKPQLTEMIRSGNAALVIGAGASVSSGAPTTAQLMTLMRSQFSLAAQDDRLTFFDLGSDICDTPAYGRLDLMKFIADHLRDLEPSTHYKQLPRVRWRALFTTNYDDLIEKAYRSKARVQGLQSVHLRDASRILARDNHVLLFYLMGSILAPHDADIAPVACWADYHRTVQLRAPVLELFKGLLATGGKVIYVGYSFNDFLLDGVLDEVIRSIGPGNVPYGFALLRDWPADKTKPFHKIQSRKVIPVEGTFEDLGQLLSEIAEGHVTTIVGGTVQPQSPATGRTVSLQSGAISFSENQAAVYSEALEILDDVVREVPKLKPGEEISQARAFFLGKSVGWLPFAKRWAFRRKAFGKVTAEVRAILKEQKSKQLPAVLVHGPAGLGKSVMARQLANDLYVDEGLPVVLVKASWRLSPDLKLLDRLCEEIEEQLPESIGMPPLVVIIDEAELLDRSIPGRLASYMRSRGRSVLLILFARTNEFFRLKDPLGGRTEKWTSGPEVRLEEKLDREEMDDLIHHLTSLPIWADNRVKDLSFWRKHITDELASSFFDAVYSLVEDTRQPLRERVWSEYQNLSPIARQAYQLIAATHQFGLPLKMEMLMRALHLSFAEFEEAIIRSDALAVLLQEHESSELNLFYRGRTRVISQLIFERAIPERSAQLEAFKQIVGSANPGEMFGVDELEIVRSLLVQVLGPSGFDNRFTAEDQGVLFKEATTQIEDDVLEHHYGLAEKNAKKYLSAREHLENALRLAALLPYDLARLRDSPQNIENSLALVLGNLATEALHRGDHEGARQLFDEARERFVRARSGQFPNAAAYDAHARMLRVRALRFFSEGSTERTLALGEALQVVSDGIDNVNADQRVTLIELHTQLLGDLGLEQDAIGDLERRASIATGKERAHLYVLLARVVLGKRDDAKKKDLRRALTYASSACEADASLEAGWRIRAEVYKQLQPQDLNGQLELIQSAQRSTSVGDNYWVLFELGVLAFELDNYELALRAFASLRRVSFGHENRSGIIEVAGIRSGSEPFEYEGRVVRSERGLAIRSEDLAIFGDLFFNPRGQRFYTPRVGDNVGFEVGFNYLGLLAADLRRK